MQRTNPSSRDRPPKFWGVVEGFYGRPWTHEQRLELIDFLARRGMNTFIYGSKDDPLVRRDWRLPYVGEALDHAAMNANAGVLDPQFNGHEPAIGVDERTPSAEDVAGAPVPERSEREHGIDDARRVATSDLPKIQTIDGRIRVAGPIDTGIRLAVNADADQVSRQHANR